MRSSTSAPSIFLLILASASALSGTSNSPVPGFAAAATMSWSNLLDCLMVSSVDSTMVSMIFMHLLASIMILSFSSWDSAASLLEAILIHIFWSNERTFSATSLSSCSSSASTSRSMRLSMLATSVTGSLVLLPARDT